LLNVGDCRFRSIKRPRNTRLVDTSAEQGGISKLEQDLGVQADSSHDKDELSLTEAGGKFITFMPNNIRRSQQ